MARARNIKPGFFRNEDLAECSFAARLCFAGLWTLADRDGRLEDRPKRIKGDLFPFDTVDVEPLLQELAVHKFILRYETDGMKAIQVLEFSKHQTPHYSEKAIGIKPPELQENKLHEECKTPENSKSHGLIKRGAQPPESLNPDSLIPDSPNPSEDSEAKASGAAAPVGRVDDLAAKAPQTALTEKPLTAKDRVWLLGVALLGDGARGLLGKLSKAHGDDVLADVLAEATLERPVEPKAWVTAACAAKAKDRQKSNGHHQAPVDLLDDPRPEWAIGAGFPDRFNAENAGCNRFNAKHFRDGRRVS